MRFQPLAVPLDSPPAMRAWLASMLRQVADALAAPTVSGIHFDTLHAEPERKSDGDVVRADGTDWNPGSGEGIYERRGGAWVRL